MKNKFLIDIKLDSPKAGIQSQSNGLPCFILLNKRLSLHKIVNQISKAHSYDPLIDYFTLDLDLY